MLPQCCQSCKRLCRDIARTTRLNVSQQQLVNRHHMVEDDPLGVVECMEVQVEEALELVLLQDLDVVTE